MQTYCLAGLAVESNIAFPELPVGTGEVGLRVVFDPTPLTRCAQANWFRSFEDASGHAWARIGLTQAGYVLRVDDRVEFALDPTGSRISCRAAAGISEQLLRELFLDLVFPMAAELNGRCVLHASAVCLGSAAIAFSGSSGVGKSTLAAGLGQCGWTALADDFLHVGTKNGRAICWPSYPGMRLEPLAATWLWGDDSPESHQSRWGKRRFVSSHRSTMGAEPLALKAAVTLQRCAELDRPELRRLGMHASYMSLYRNAYHLDPQGDSSLGRSLCCFGDLADALPCFQLRFPEGRQWIPQIQATLAPLLTSPAHGAKMG